MKSVGTEDPDTTAKIAEYFNNAESEWGLDKDTSEAAKKITIDVMTTGFPDKFDGSEEYKHQLAAECLADIFKSNEDLEESSWRWSALNDTLHTVPGFEEPIQELVDVLDEGSP